MPAGRPTGVSTTREDLLIAAAETFAERGYDSASIRMITDKIGVDAALVRHYFGDKDGLFAAAVLQRIDIDSWWTSALSGAPSTMGARLAQAYLELWEQDDEALALRALLRSALDSDIARHLIQETLERKFVSGAGLLLPDLDRARLTFISTQLLGTAMIRYILRLEPAASMPLADVVAEIAPNIQRLLDH